MPLLAGIATVDITPPVGVWLAGFAGRHKPSEGVHDPLRARCLVLDDGQTRLAIITNDLLSMGYDLVDEIKGMIAEECDLPPEQVMLNCSHTHSGPAMRRAAEPSGPNACFVLDYRHKIVGLVKMALADLRPARIGSARTEVQVGINRRERTPEGTILGRNPDLPVAPWVDVVRVDDPDGKLRAVLFSHACHPVTMAGDNYHISADYPGRAQEVVEGVFAGAQAVFAQGCHGNVNSEPVGGTFDDVWRLGTVLGGAVVKAAALCATCDSVALRYTYRRADLPLEDPPPVAEAMATHEAAVQAVEDAEASGDAGRAKVLAYHRDWAERVLELAEEGATGLTMRYDLQVFAIGDLAVVGLPGEVFVEYQLAVDGASPFSQTIVTSVTNGCPSYIPCASEFPFGGYEVTDAIRYYGATMLKPECEQVILQGVGEMLASLA